jgi:uncharacterized membrane protein
MRVYKLLLLVIACSIIPFGTAQLFYQSSVEPFPALLYQGIIGIACGCFVMMRICDDDIVKDHVRRVVHRVRGRYHE